MIIIKEDKCTGCNICIPECPMDALTLVGKLAVVDDKCTECNLCVKVCSLDAIEMTADHPEGTVECRYCPVLCKVRPGTLGACHRYRNVDGVIVRDSPLWVPSEEDVDWQLESALHKPLMLGVGVGTTSPDFLPAPYIAEEDVDGLDVVTAVTEVPLSYSSIRVKIDTNMDIGPEGAIVKRDGLKIGMVVTEEYGAKMLSIGGVHYISGRTGSTAARTIVDIANRKRVTLKVQKGADLEIQVGHPPVINGITDSRMRVGCGCAVLGMFGEQFARAADEVIVVDPHLTGQLTDYTAGRYLKLKPSGIVARGKKKTPGRYAGEPGEGWGGTTIKEPEDAIASIDPNVAWPGMTILVVDTNGDRAAMLEHQSDGSLKRIPLNPVAEAMKQLLADSSEPARVSAIFVGGVGGSARASLTTVPPEVNKAIRAGEMKLTVGGADTFIYPGGNLIFEVDVEKVPEGSFDWIPAPACVVPVEYTTTRAVYQRISGRMESVRPLREVLQERELKRVQ